MQRCKSCDMWRCLTGCIDCVRGLLLVSTTATWVRMTLMAVWSHQVSNSLHHVSRPRHTPRWTDRGKSIAYDLKKKSNFSHFLVVCHVISNLVSKQMSRRHWQPWHIWQSEVSELELVVCVCSYSCIEVVAEELVCFHITTMTLHLKRLIILYANPRWVWESFVHYPARFWVSLFSKLYGAVFQQRPYSDIGIWSLVSVISWHVKLLWFDAWVYCK